MYNYLPLLLIKCSKIIEFDHVKKSACFAILFFLIFICKKVFLFYLGIKIESFPLAKYRFAVID